MVSPHRAYENEFLKSSWSKRELQRQISSLLYERTGLSRDKQAVIERARRQASDARLQISDLIRDPYVLEFVGLAGWRHITTGLIARGNPGEGLSLAGGTFRFESRVVSG
jgi:predicted nuclease of restriction endonuclease-like (RecB) superfamily